MKIQVTRNTWKFGGAAPKVQAVRIKTPYGFLRVPMEQVRALCDELHDLADDYYREQREAANND